jgi:hypothetical protein
MNKQPVIDTILGTCHKCSAYTDIYKKTIMKDDIGICLFCFSNAMPSKITKNLYLSDYENSKKYGLLKKLGIKQIITVGYELEHKNTEFKTMHIKIDDVPSANLYSQFIKTYEFIEKDKTVVHCMMGVSRSATIAISYIMQKKRIGYDEAHKLCKRKRPIIDPNPGFIQQLKRMEKIMVKAGYIK